MNPRTMQMRSERRARAGRGLGCLRAALLALLVSCPSWVLPGALSAQTPDDAPIRELIARLDRGETEAVRQQLPDLVAKYQNHPGILFVQARVATDGIESAKLYQSVLDNYPASEWADDALYNLYQYYYAMGLYKTAELRMQQLRKEYPASEHLTGKQPPPGPAAGGESRPGPPPLSPPVMRDSAGLSAPPAGTGGEDVTTRDTPKQDAPGEEAVLRERRAREQAAHEQAVRDSAPSPDRTEPAQTSPAGGMPYTLQTGAFSTSENARKQKEMFEERGYAAEITNRVRGGRSLYLVWVGSFRTPEEARRVLVEIQSRYSITPIVVER